MCAYLKGGHHFALFFSVQEIVQVLHRDERSEFVRDGVVWITDSRCGKLSVRAGD